MRMIKGAYLVETKGRKKELMDVKREDEASTLLRTSWDSQVTARNETRGGQPR